MSARDLIGHSGSLELQLGLARDPLDDSGIGRIHAHAATAHPQTESVRAEERDCVIVVLSDAGEERTVVPPSPQLFEQCRRDPAATLFRCNHAGEEKEGRVAWRTDQGRRTDQCTVFFDDERSSTAPVLVKIRTVQLGDLDEHGIVRPRLHEQRTDLRLVQLTIRADHASESLSARGSAALGQFRMRRTPTSRPP
jgi:hypothetical protein